MRRKLPESFQNGRRELEIAQGDVTDEALEKLKPLLKPGKEGEAKIVLTQSVSRYHSGPLPPAEELEHYESVSPGAADRVIAMAEREQAHRHETMSSIVEKEFSLRSKGPWFAIITLFAILSVVAYIASLGDAKPATWLGSITIVSAMALFITGKFLDKEGPLNGDNNASNKNSLQEPSKQKSNQMKRSRRR